MTIAKRLEQQLVKLFLISVGLGLFVLVISTYISTIQVKEKVISFITSHVKEISSAEVNAQNVSEIDREVRRLYDTWQSTQDIDIRVEVFLNGKLVGQAGQLQRFGFFSSLATKEYPLPSSQVLNINVELNLLNQLLYDALLFLVFAIFLGGCFYLLRKSLGRTIREVTLPLQDRINWLTTVAQDLPASLKRDAPPSDSSLLEVENLDRSLSMFTGEILNLESKIKEAGYQEGRVKMAEQLAHTIKGKLALLQLRINNASDLKDAEKVRLLSSVFEVEDAAQNLLKSGRSEKEATKSRFDEILDVAQIVNQVIEQKREIFAAKSNVALTVKSPGVPVKTRSSHIEFEAALSNIIDNAFEAIPESGKIEIELKTQNSVLSVEIGDTGRGISEDILPRLATERATFGKNNGNGLGLFHARKTIEASGGALAIKSKVGVGTTITLTLPVYKARSVESHVITVTQGQTLIVTDDDSCIHAAIDLTLEDKPPVSVVHLHSAQEFENWMSENGPGDFGSRVYWMDFDLKDGSRTGFSLISKYGIQFESFLITGMAGDKDLIQQTGKQGVRLISKSSIPRIEVKEDQQTEVREIAL